MTEIVILLAVLLCIFFAILAYYSKAPFFIKLITLPTLSIFLIFTIYLMIIKAGAPIAKIPDGEWLYVHHKVELDNKENKMLYIWSNQEIGNRLYVMPYNRETAKKLEIAKMKMEAGFSQMGEFKMNGEGNEPQLFLSDPSQLKGKDIPKFYNPNQDG